MNRLLLTTALGTALLAPAFANAVPLVADGVSYTLTASSVNTFTEHFTLTITGENTASDTEGGRTGINAIALNQPTNGVVTSGIMSAPAGFTFILGGLNSAGCDGSGNFFCFDNTAIPPTPTTLLSGTLTFNFNVTASTAGAWTGYTTAFKIDWVGTKNNYDLVSLPIDVDGITPPPPPPPPPPVPEPSTLLILGAGLIGLGYASRRRT